MIQMLGRWRSDAYKLYIKIPQAELAKVSQALVWPFSVFPRFSSPSVLWPTVVSLACQFFVVLHSYEWHANNNNNNKGIIRRCHVGMGLLAGSQPCWLEAPCHR